MPFARTLSAAVFVLLLAGATDARALDMPLAGKRLGLRTGGRERLVEVGRGLSDEQADALIRSQDAADTIALATYGRALIRRCRGEDDGSASLVLWRQFAWDRTTPKEGFELTADAILDAERRIRERVAR